MHQLNRRLLRDSAPQPQPPARRPLPVRRWILWGIEFIILLAVLERFVLRPAYRRAHGGDRRAAAVRPPDTPVDILAKPVLLPFCRQVEDAVLPGTGDLPEDAAEMQRRQRRCSEAFQLPIEIENSIGIRFRLVPEGTAAIGSPETEPGRGDDEQRHPQAIEFPFYLSKFEITQRQWETVMGRENNPSGFAGPDRPVEEVTWYQCQEFIQKLCLRENLSAQAYALPLEHEWEYACRGGCAGAYCFGDDPARLADWAQYAENNFTRTSPVGSRRCNSLGLYDMHGNVWEWCRDRFHSYPGGAKLPSSCNDWRNLRGGNWYVGAAECRSASRARLTPTSHGNMLGFRILRLIDVDLPRASARKAVESMLRPATVPGGASPQFSIPAPENP